MSSSFGSKLPMTIRVHRGEPEDACCFCRQEDGTPVRRAPFRGEKTYQVNGISRTLTFRICALCRFLCDAPESGDGKYYYCRRFFVELEGVLISQTLDRLREEDEW